MGQCWYNRVGQYIEQNDIYCVERIPSSQTCVTRTMSDTTSANSSASATSDTTLGSRGTANSVFSTKIYHEPSRIVRTHNWLPNITELKNSVSVEDAESIPQGFALQTYIEYPLKPAS
jgi:hypothetical protein